MPSGHRSNDRKMGEAARKLKFDESELLNVSKIAMRCGIHRQTCQARLDDLGYEPEIVKAKEKLYRCDAEMIEAVKAAKDTLSAVKIRDLRASATLKELKLDEARGELVPMGEVIETVQKVMTAVHKAFSLQMPKRLSGKLARCKTTPEVSKILKAETDRIFTALRGNFEEFIA